MMKKLFTSIAVMLMAGAAWSSIPGFNGRYTVSGYDVLATNSWRLYGTFQDSSLQGWGAADVDTNDNIYIDSNWGDIDRYVITNIVVQTGFNLTCDVNYDQTGTPRAGAPSAGFLIICDSSYLPSLEYDGYTDYLRNGARNLMIAALAASSSTDSSAIHTNEIGSGLSWNSTTKVLTATNSSSGSGLPDVIYDGDTTTTLGKIYQQASDGTWDKASCTNVDLCSGMLAVAVGTNSSSTGMVTLGKITVTNALTVGSAIFVSADAGELSQTAPTNVGYVIRVAGYATDTNEVYVCPSPTWVEIGDIYGTSDSTAARGDWFAVVSNTATAALPKTFTNAAAVTTMKITGGTPAVGDIFVVTNANGSGTLQAPATYVTRESTQTTNDADLVVSGCPFKPAGVTIIGMVQNYTEGLSQAYTDSTGVSRGAFYKQSAGTYARVAYAIRLRDAGDKDYDLVWKSWNSDGATFEQRPEVGAITNDVELLMYFHQ